MGDKGYEWAWKASALAERRRIRRAIAPALKRLKDSVPYGSSSYGDLCDIDWATKAPRGRAKR